MGAALLALGFPKFHAAGVAPLGAAALFWAWQRLSWKRSFWFGWLAGVIFFSISFSWIANALGSDLGILAPLIVIIVATILGLSFALAAILARVAYWRALPSLAPLGAAVGFTLVEWLRSSGPLGVPFEQLGYAQTETILRVFAPYAGAFGITFAVCVAGAYIAHAIETQDNRPLVACLAALLLLGSLAWFGWPARRSSPAPDMRVTALQGNVPQSIKWGGRKALDDAIARYSRLTRSAAAFAPQLVAWPETAATVRLNYDAQNGPRVMTQLGTLARGLRTTLVVGSLDVHRYHEFNAAYIFAPDGWVHQIYDKRQLVPFAETFPGRTVLGWLPGASLIGNLGIGTDDAVIATSQYTFAPIICWESAFPELIHRQLARGAQVLLVVTDDAWFGETSGPYQHAQIAQMRALESGAWLVRAAQTGISGIIAPDGRWTQQTALDREAVVLGTVGPPSPTVFARIGPAPVIAVLAALYLAIVFVRPRP